MVISRKRKFLVMMESIQSTMDVVLMYYLYVYLYVLEHYYNCCTLNSSSTFERTTARLGVMHRVVYRSDKVCLDQLRVNRPTFKVLCHMLRTISRLEDTRHCDVEEMVAIFLYVLSHHFKNRVNGSLFWRSGDTISRHFNTVLKGVILLQNHLLKEPEAVTDDSADGRWKWFKNCLGALDGTYIEIKVPAIDKPRYRSRKHGVATNVLGVCSQNMEFIFVYPGWKGSAADSRILREAISRRNGLKVPHGYYYLVDAGYPNSRGFLAPFRGQRYHLTDWDDGYLPTKAEELFNMKHSSARNIIERAFGILKMRWGILRGPSWYPVKIHCRIIIACCLIHNLIRREMPSDDVVLNDNFDDELEDPNFSLAEGAPIEFIEPSGQWNIRRKELADQMWAQWNATRRRRQ